MMQRISQIGLASKEVFLAVLFLALMTKNPLLAVSSSSVTTAILYPEDLGPLEIDVENYPPQYQKIYRDIARPMSGSFGGAARLFNSPIIELSSEQEQIERHENPWLFTDPTIVQPSINGWKKRVEEVRLKPPCCGACAVLNRADENQLWEFLVYDSLVRKTGRSAKAWIDHRKSLLARFQKEYPDRFSQLYVQSATKREENK